MDFEHTDITEFANTTFQLPKGIQINNNVLLSNKGFVKPKDRKQFSIVTENEGKTIDYTPTSLFRVTKRQVSSSKNLNIHPSTFAPKQAPRKYSVNANYSVEEKKELWKMCKNIPSFEVIKIIQK